MKKTLAITALAAISTLALTACSNNSPAESPQQPIMTTIQNTPPPTSTETQGTIGEPLNIQCDPRHHHCDVDLTITSLETSTTCPPVDYAETVIEPDEMYLTISGEMEVHETTQQNGFGMSQAFSVIDSDGYTQPVKTAHGCDYEFGTSWETVRTGEKRESSERVIVPENAEKLVIDPFYATGPYVYALN